MRRWILALLTFSAVLIAAATAGAAGSGRADGAVYTLTNSAAGKDPGPDLGPNGTRKCDG